MTTTTKFESASGGLADYEMQLIKQFKKLEQYWLNKKPDQYIAKCVFFLEAFGVSPRLQVGFEEALYLANKIKNNLRGSLSTEKVLYLLFMTLQKQGCKNEAPKTQGAANLSQTEKEQEEKEQREAEGTFQAFIIRYLYHLREQRIVQQVQKMGSMEQVQAYFRSDSDQALLQFHQIDYLSNGATSQIDGKSLPPNSHALGSCDDKIAQMDHGSRLQASSVISSKRNPEMCARNSQGQFMSRSQAVRPPPIDLKSDDDTSCIADDQIQQSVISLRRESKMQQKKAVKSEQSGQRGGVLGKRLRKEVGGPSALQDTPDLVFAQTAALGEANFELKNEMEGPKEKIEKNTKIGVSSSQGNITSTFSNQKLKGKQLIEGQPLQDSRSGCEGEDRQRSFYSQGLASENKESIDDQALWKVVSKKTLAQRPLEAKLFGGGNPKNSAEASGKKEPASSKLHRQNLPGQSSQQSLHQIHTGQQRQQTADPSTTADKKMLFKQRPTASTNQAVPKPVHRAPQENNENSSHDAKDDSHSHTLTEKSANGLAYPSTEQPQNSARNFSRQPVMTFRMVGADDSLPQESPRNSLAVKSAQTIATVPRKQVKPARVAQSEAPVSLVQSCSSEGKAFSAPACDALKQPQQQSQQDQEHDSESSEQHQDCENPEDMLMVNRYTKEDQNSASKLVYDLEANYGEEEEEVEGAAEESEQEEMMSEGEDQEMEYSESGADDPYGEEVEEEAQLEQELAQQDTSQGPAQNNKLVENTVNNDNTLTEPNQSLRGDDNCDAQGDQGMTETDKALEKRIASSSSQDSTGRIAHCYTVYKLEHKDQKSVKPEAKKANDAENSESTPAKQSSPNKSAAETESNVGPGRPPKSVTSQHSHAGIYQMLMRITHGIKDKKKPIKKVIQKKKPSSKTSSQKLKEEKQKIKKVVDPQILLYQEQDMKIALNQQAMFGKNGNNVIKRRQQRHNYLAYSEPFDLNVLLQDSYWEYKQSLLSHSHQEIIRLSSLNKMHNYAIFEDAPIYDFLDFKESVDSELFKVSHIFWQNAIDSAVPYQSGFQNHFWNYIKSNEIVNNNIRQYLAKAKRQSFCNCLDGCQNSRKCPCYKWNRKLQNPTYNKILSPRSGQMIAFQQRAKTSINKVFSFNECHPRCSCNKDLCQNYLIQADNKKKFQFLIRRLQKTLSPIYQDVQELQNRNPMNTQGPTLGANAQALGAPPAQTSGSSNHESQKLSSVGIFSQRPKQISMWGLIAMEEIPAGAFLMEYLGEIVSKKQGDMRGTYYDANGLSYLFDLNDPCESDEREQIIQKVYYNEFFPLCLDSMFYGNEARFINHSCDPNVLSFNLTGQVDSNVYHSIGLFASRKILPGEELTLDYQWDKNDLTISQDVPCLCGSLKCRGFLMRAKKIKKPQQNVTNMQSQVTSKQDEASLPRAKSAVEPNSLNRPPSGTSLQSLQSAIPLFKGNGAPSENLEQASSSVAQKMPLSAGFNLAEGSQNISSSAEVESAVAELNSHKVPLISAATQQRTNVRQANENGITQPLRKKDEFQAANGVNPASLPHNYQTVPQVRTIREDDIPIGGLQMIYTGEKLQPSRPSSTANHQRAATTVAPSMPQSQNNQNNQMNQRMHPHSFQKQQYMARGVGRGAVTHQLQQMSNNQTQLPLNPVLMQQGIQNAKTQRPSHMQQRFPMKNQQQQQPRQHAQAPNPPLQTKLPPAALLVNKVFPGTTPNSSSANQAASSATRPLVNKAQAAATGAHPNRSAAQVGSNGEVRRFKQVKNSSGLSPQRGQQPPQHKW